MAAETLNQLLLERVDKDGSVDTLTLAVECNRDHQSLVGAVKSLQAFGNVSIKLRRLSSVLVRKITPIA